MKMTTKILSALLACLMLVSMTVISVSAEGTQENPINANDKWFGYGVDIFLLNPTLEPGDTDGIWYELTADANGILQVENTYKEVDYQITVTVNGQTYLAYENGVYNMPIITLPVVIGDVISIHIIAQDTSMGGLVYVSGKFITGENEMTQTVKLKGAGVRVWVANGATVYFQDDSLQADYAVKGLNLTGSTVEGITVISNTERYTDTDGDAVIELQLGGSAGSAGAPPVKPSFAIENLSGEDAWFLLNVTDTAHECSYDNDADADCNTCGAIREVEPDEPFLTPGQILSFGGNSVSADVNGVAFRFNTEAKGIVIGENYAADYTNATVTIEGVEYKLVGMGAVLNNIEKDCCILSDVDGINVLDITAAKVMAEDDGSLYYSVRITDIPDDYKDARIIAVPYYIYECEGEPITVYCAEYAASYNGVEVA